MKLPPCDHDECPPTRCIRVRKNGQVSPGASLTAKSIAVVGAWCGLVFVASAEGSSGLVHELAGQIASVLFACGLVSWWFGGFSAHSQKQNRINPDR